MRSAVRKSQSILMLGALLTSCTLSNLKNDNAIREPASQSKYGVETATSLNSVSGLTQFAGKNGDLQMKFILPDFETGVNGESLFLSPSFYQFHDDWYLFHMLTGRPVAGLVDQPVSQLNFESPRKVQEYLAGLQELPARLVNAPPQIQKVQKRFVSTRFYTLSQGPQRKYGLGSIMYTLNPKRKMKSILAFDMIFNDQPNESDLKVFYGRLSRDLNSPNLVWLPRSKGQEALAANLKTKSDWKNRIITYDDLIVPGEVQIYSYSNVAGHVKYFARGEFDLERVNKDDIVLLDELPDELPPVRGIITTVPQSELSHINILSRGRGTLNAYVADPNMIASLKKTALQGTVVAIAAQSGSNELKIVEMNTEEYAQYLKYFTTEPMSLTPVKLDQMKYIYPLKTLLSYDRAGVVRLVGGKAAGMIQLMKAHSPTVPFALGISVKPYREMLNSGIGKLIEGVMRDKRFQENPKIRLLALEGPSVFKEKYPRDITSDIQKLIDGTDTSVLAQVISKGGVQKAIESTPLSAGLIQELEGLKKTYSSLPRGQGLRFRSSSDVEDIPGFVGAGLYESYTGYPDPLTQAPATAKKTMARAIQKVWSSYWKFRAFEERSLAGIDHLSGSMAVMVHPNFPDTVEKANGVITIKWDKDRTNGDFYRLTINAHEGEASVVRPDGSLGQPQSVSAYESFGQIYIEKMTPTSEGVEVLNKSQIENIFRTSKALLISWVNDENKSLKPEWKHWGYQLDIEFKFVPKQWSVDYSAQGEYTLILKQARPLMSISSQSKKLTQLPIPRGMLGEAVRIYERKIKNAEFEFTTNEVYVKDTPHDGGFNADANFKFLKAMENFSAGSTIKFTHVEYKTNFHGFMHHGPWDLTIEFTDSAAKAKGISSINCYSSGTCNVAFTNGKNHDFVGTFSTTDILVGPNDWIAKFVAGKLPPPPRTDVDGPRIRF